MPTLIDDRRPVPSASVSCLIRPHSLIAFFSLLVAFSGCGEPSLRERENRRELEALLTAIALKNSKELDKDEKRIADRHATGALSDEGFKNLEKIVATARAGDWAAAEKQAYELRESTPFFQ